MVERSAMAESLSNLSSAALNSQPSTFDKLCEIVAKLRGPDGCPWDREQTHESLLPATIEEAYEGAEGARARWCGKSLRSTRRKESVHRLAMSTITQK